MGEITGERKMSFDINKCKPFDLKRALAGDKVVTSGGAEVTEIQYFKTLLSDYPIFAVVSGTMQRFSISGDWYYQDSANNTRLLMAPKTKKFEAWVSVYPTGFGGVTWNNEYDASVGMSCIKTIKIETEIEI
jgi:hypothetical protein